MIRRSLLPVGLLAVLSAPLGSAQESKSPDQAPKKTPEATPSPAPAPSARPPTAKDRKRGTALVAKAVLALGGAAALDAVKSLDLEGQGTRQLPNGGEIEARLHTQFLFPDRYRQETVLPGGRMATLLGPQGAFVILEELALPLPEEEMASLKKLVRRNLVALLQARRDPAYAPVFAGAGAVAGTRVERVTVHLGDEPTTLAIDPKTGRILELSYTASGPSGTLGAFVISYSDYRRVDGLSYPFAVNGTFEGKPAFSSRLSSATINRVTDEAVFDPPPPPSPPPSPAPGQAGVPQEAPKEAPREGPAGVPGDEKKPTPPPDAH